MLVLSRKKNESIVINGNITVTVVEIRGDKIRLGIDAPMEVPVHRSEVQDALERERKREAAAKALLDKLDESELGKATNGDAPEALRKYGG